MGTLARNVVGVVVLGAVALTARSVALAGLGRESLIEFGASTAVLREIPRTVSSASGAALGPRVGNA